MEKEQNVLQQQTAMGLNWVIQTTPDDGGWDGLRNVGLLSTTDTACCPRRIYRVYGCLRFVTKD
jgi:hypothetical protein